MTRRSRQYYAIATSCRASLAGVCMLFAACQQAPTQTHIVLDVQIAGAIAKQVTSVVVHGEESAGARTDDVTQASQGFRPGDTPRFVLQPAANRAQLQVRVVALRDREEIASAVLRSSYAAGRGLYLGVSLGCTGAYDLGKQQASESPAAPLDSCAFSMTEASRAGSGGTGGKLASGGAPAAGNGSEPALTRAGTGGNRTPNAGRGEDGSAGASGRAGLGPTSGTEATTGSSGTAARSGSGGAGTGGAAAAGSGGVSGAAAAGGGGTSGAAAAGSGGVSGPAAGSGGAGTSGAAAAGGGGSGGTPYPPNCLNWRKIATISSAIETLSPEAYVAGHELRDNPTEDIPQFICRATPPGVTQRLVGKASRWGCYLPGPDTTAYTVMDDVEILISSNTAPCLAWKPLNADQAPTSPLIFGDTDARVCRVTHSGVADNRNTSGERVGQVRFESGQYVCRYEFYYYIENTTYVNLPGETTQVLDLASQ